MSERDCLFFPSLTLNRVPAFVEEAPAEFISSPEPPELGTIQAVEVPTIDRALDKGGSSALDEPTSNIIQQGEMPLLAATPAVSVSFDSLDFVNNGTETGFVFIPPDPIAAAGPNHVVNVVNVMVRFHQKNGTVDFSDSLRDFFADPLRGKKVSQSRNALNRRRRNNGGFPHIFRQEWV